MKFLLGKKIGMTNLIDEKGSLIPVTILEAGPCYITQVKNQEKDGYDALQIGFTECKKVNKAKKGHLKGVGKNLKNIKEFRIKDAKNANLKVGDELNVSVFEKGDRVNISGNIKAKGFTGPVKRWGFRGGPGGHGHPQERKVGSIGSGYPQHVFRGTKMGGRKGSERKTILGLEIIDIDKNNNLLVVKGSVPGVRGRLVEIRG